MQTRLPTSVIFGCLLPAGNQSKRANMPSQQLCRRILFLANDLSALSSIFIGSRGSNDLSALHRQPVLLLLLFTSLHRCLKETPTMTHLLSRTAKALLRKVRIFSQKI